MRREEGNWALPHIVWDACSNVEFLKGAKRTTSLTWSQLCLFFGTTGLLSSLYMQRASEQWRRCYLYRSLFFSHMGQRGPTVVRFTPRFKKNSKRVLFSSGLNFSNLYQMQWKIVQRKIKAEIQNFPLGIITDRKQQPIKHRSRSFLR